MERATIKEIGSNVDTISTSLHGYLEATYLDLVKAFGEPTYDNGEEDKVTKEWSIEFTDGTVATIYDWKSSRALQGLYQWHIGGENKIAVANVHEVYEDRLAEKAGGGKWTFVEKEEDQDEDTVFYKLLYDADEASIEIAQRRWNKITLKYDYAWNLNLSAREDVLISLLPSNTKVFIFSKTGKLPGFEDLSWVEAKAKKDLAVEWEVSVDFDYEAEVDLGEAGVHTAYGYDVSCSVQVEAINIEEAKAKAVVLVEEDYHIFRAEAMVATRC